ncbi:MAG: YMGG-like glycine zipper-containing protein [Bacteroidales bacterium]
MKKLKLKMSLAIIIMGLSLSSFGQTTGDAINKKVGLYVFPSNNQTAEQQEQDESYCYTWAVQQSGYDPINPTTVQAKQVDQGPDGSAVKGAAGGAAVGAAIGAISGDAGKGAAIGAVSGAVLGRRRGMMAQASQQQQANEQAAQTNQNLVDGFKKAYTACLEGKNYTVK